MSNKTKFIEEYAAALRQNHHDFPNTYMVPHDGWHGLAARMADGFIRGTSHTSDLAKRVCAKLGGKYSTEGVRAYLMQARELEMGPL